jgi:hypothetical protein
VLAILDGTSRVPTAFRSAMRAPNRPPWILVDRNC